MSIFLGMGEQDKSVPVESAHFMASKFAEADKRNLTLKIYPGADHRLVGNGVSYREDFFKMVSERLH